MRTVVHRLLRQADAQVAAVSFEHAQVAAHDVVQHLVATAEAHRLAGGGVVLPVDPVGDQHRRGHQQLEHRAIGIMARVVVVQEDATAQVQPAGTGARCHDEGRVAGQPPLRARFGPIVGAASVRFEQGCGVGPGIQPQEGCALASNLVTRALQGHSQQVPGAADLVGQGRGVEDLDLVGGGVVQSRDEHGVRWHRQALRDEACADLRRVQQVGQRTGVDFTSLAATGAAVQ